MLFPLAGGNGAVIKLGELVMILDLHRQGLSVSAIARQLGVDRKAVRSAIAKGLEPPGAAASDHRSVRALFEGALGGLSRPHSGALVARGQRNAATAFSETACATCGRRGQPVL